MSTIRIFLASSSELQDDREQFEIFVGRKNKEWQGKGRFLELTVWEDFLDAVSKTRKQDDYNEAVRTSDVFILLFYTKVGKYTEEEFDTAFGQFKATGKPHIFTYFKTAQLSTEDITDEILSLLNFQKKLDKLGHFYSRYKSVEHLNLEFNQQMEKLFGNARSGIENSPASGMPKLPKELTLNIPKTSPLDIVGREQDLQELHELLCNDKRVVVVNGLGGIGKTTLAQVYVSKYESEYQHIAWVTQTTSDVASDFLNTEGLLKQLGIEADKPEPQALFEEIIYKLRSVEERPNLLIIDNADGSLFEHRSKLPSQPTWHLLITSREEIESFHTKLIDFLNEQHALSLFKKHYTLKELNDAEIKELIRVVEYHTLTIEILAKTAKVQRYDAATLKKAIERDLRANVKVQRLGGKVEKIDKIGSYLNSVFSLSKLTEVEVWLMKQFVCLPSEYHTYALLKEFLTEESTYQEVFAETLNGLTQKGWLLYNRETDSYKMHHVIAQITKQQHQLNPKDVEVLVNTITGKLSLNQDRDNPVDKFVWVPFGRAILASIQDDSSEAISILQNNLALVLKDLGDYEGAKELLEKAVASGEKSFGPAHPSTATSYSNLALVLKDLGDYEGAKELLEKAVASDEKSFGPAHPSTATSYSNLALVLQNLGDYKRALDLTAIALSIFTKILPEGHPHIAVVSGNYEAIKKKMD